MAVLRPEAIMVQNNMAEASQHIENGLSMAAIKHRLLWIVTGMTLAGIQLQDWLIMATIIYTLYKYHCTPKRKVFYAQQMKDSKAFYNSSLVSEFVV